MPGGSVNLIEVCFSREGFTFILWILHGAKYFQIMMVQRSLRSLNHDTRFDLGSTLKTLLILEQLGSLHQVIAMQCTLN